MKTICTTRFLNCEQAKTLIALCSYYDEPDVYHDESTLVRWLEKTNRLLQTALALNEGKAVWKDEQNELFESEHHLLHVLYGLLYVLKNENTDQELLTVTLQSVHGDVMITY